MKKLLALILAISPLASLAGTFYDGNKLQALGLASQKVSEQRAPTASEYSDASVFLGYIVATSDAFDGVLFCSPSNATAGQLMAVTRKYLREHPERWSEPAVRLVIAALQIAFPCPTGK